MVKTYKVGAHISKDADLILEEQLLLSPGRWKGVNFTAEEIMKGIDRTNWNDSEVSSILKNHPQKGALPSAEDWIGDLKNVRYLTLDDGVDKEGMYGDAYIYDQTFAKKVVYGKAKLAFSIDSPFRDSKYGATDLSFSRTATVYRAGCKDAYIQLSDSEEEPKMRFISEDLSIQLSDEVGDEENSNINTKGETTRVMQEKTSNSSVQLEEATPAPVAPVAPVAPAAPAIPAIPAPVAAPVIETPTPVAPAAPVVAPTPIPAPVAPAAPAVVKEVAPSKEIIDNSNEIGELKTQVEKLTKTILEMSKPKVEEPKVEIKVEPVKIEPTPVKTEEVKKPAMSQTVAQIEDGSQPDLSNMTKFEKAHARINSTNN